MVYHVTAEEVFYSEWSFVKSTFIRVFTQGRRKEERKTKGNISGDLSLFAKNKKTLQQFFGMQMKNRV